MTRARARSQKAMRDDDDDNGGATQQKESVDEGYVSRTLLHNGNPLHSAAYLSIFTIEAEI